MRVLLRLVLIVALLPVSFAHAGTQEGVNARGIVDSAEISGIDEGDISQTLRDDIHKLIGQPFDQKAADDLVARLQDEKPEYNATTRLAPGSQSDRVKVIFLLEKIDFEAAANVNSRYTVESVEIQGYDESRLSQSIRDEIRKLVGEKLDSDKTNRILQEIEDELRPRRYVVKRVAKGSDRQHVVVVYEVKSARWIPFVSQPRQQIVYHSKQNFSGVVNGNIFDTRSTRLYFGMADDQDQLLERFAGFNFGFETTKIGTDRLGLALRYARFHDRWQPSTVAADQNGIYRNRNSFDPSITFAFDPRLRITAGVSLSGLQIQYPAIHDSNANAAVGSVQFQNVWGGVDTDRHSLGIDYEFRAGNHQLNSDFIYTRHFAEAQYQYGHGKSNLLLRFTAGTIAGNAPLFDRFSLGNTVTLRGWNKFDIAPAGGNRMIHGTVQYGVATGKGHIQIDPHPSRDVAFGFHVFYDVGAVGDAGSPIQARHAVGFGFGPASSSKFFIDLGFPIRSSHVLPIFMTGFRF
jgi:outer membrane protein assembly factor BamA